MGDFWIYCGACPDYDYREVESLIAKAQTLAGEKRVCALVLSKEPAQVLPCLTGADQVLWVSTQGSPIHQGDVLTQLARQRQPEVILFSATALGAQVAARAAAFLNAGLSADCTDLWMDGENLVMHRPAFGGGVEADILSPNHRPQMATVRPGIFAILAPVSAQAELECIDVPQVGEDPIELLAQTIVPAAEDIRNARILVAGGQGVGSKENFALLEKLAQLLGGQVAASRAAVDAGFAPWDRQVGQTGQIVTPKLYIALGISGSIQHIMGMHGADRIIAVNTDPKAPIFDYADVAINADWKPLVEDWIHRLTH